MVSALNVFVRHPRYALCLVLVLVPALYLILPLFEPPISSLNIPLHDYTDLTSKVAQSEAIYQHTIQEREGLIARFGPQPSDLELFPPNTPPWPPYTVWDFFPAAFNCPHEVRRIGVLGDGGKWVCGLSRLTEKKDCVIYSFGINEESSFEAGLLANTNHCKIWGYDFSVKGFAKQIPYSQKHRTIFHPYGLAGTDHVSTGDEPTMYTLETLMKMNGHQHIDILKIDIEGWEFETMTDILKSFSEKGLPLPFGQLQIEIHIWNKKFDYFLKWWEGFEEAGLRPFWTEPNLVYVNYADSRKPDLAEYSFLNIKGDNAFTS